MNKKLLCYLAVGVSCLGITSHAKANEVDDAFLKLAPNDILEVNAIKPKSDSQQDFFLNRYVITTMNSGDYYMHLENCNEEQTLCDAIMSFYKENNSLEASKKLTIKWQEADENKKSTVLSYKEKILKTKTTFTIDDLPLLNHYQAYNGKDVVIGMNIAGNYTTELNQMIDNAHVGYSFDLRAGESYDMYSYGMGALVLTYDDIAYDTISPNDYDKNVGLTQSNILYISEDTPDTVIDYQSAAQKRLDAYFGTGKYTITIAGKRSEYTEYEQPFDFSIIGDESKMGDSYYTIKIGDKTYPFVIMKDNSKIESTPIASTVDKDTGIKVVTTDSSVPLDAKVIVKEIEKDTDTHKTIADTLKITEFKAFDISLYSKTLSDNIKKLENGVFQVTIPLGNEYVGKNLSAYYITDTKIEEHKITLDEHGNATFETDHFSTYIVAEAGLTLNGELVPKTYDPIKAILVTGLMSTIALVGSAIYLKKGKQN